jgi:hypothetical protein
MTAWLAMTVAAVARMTIRQASPVRPHLKEWMIHYPTVRKNECALTKVVEEQAWKHQGEPGKHDGSAPEMTQIDIESFSSCHSQKHRA